MKGIIEYIENTDFETKSENDCDYGMYIYSLVKYEESIKSGNTEESINAIEDVVYKYHCNRNNNSAKMILNMIKENDYV